MIPNSSNMASFKIKGGVGGIGEAIRYPPPPGLVPGGNGVVDHCLYLPYPPRSSPHSPRPCRRPASFYLILPHSSASDFFRGIIFSTSFLMSFLSHFGLPFEAPNRRTCLQAVIQNRPSKFVCPIFGFGTLCVNFRPPRTLKSERLALTRCICFTFLPFPPFFGRLGPKSRQHESNLHPKFDP